ncbi:MAG: aspartyl protease family protein [Bacteroidia bacterium]
MAIGGKEFVIDYDAYRRPSLLIDITVSSPDKSTIEKNIKRALIDTGSDFTLLPKDIINSLNLKPTGNEYKIIGFDDDKKKKKKKVKFYMGKVKIDGVIETLLEVGAIDSEPLIGMNLLSKLHILINSPKGTFEMANKSDYIHPTSS